MNALILAVLIGLATLCTAASPEKLECGENEVYNRCGRACEPTCSYTVNICIKRCGPPACVCKKGFYRNSEKQCTKDCSNEKCFKNMVRKTCGLPVQCQASCASTTGVRALPKTCAEKKCLPNACECKPGYVLKIQSYTYPQCVPEESCKKPTENKRKQKASPKE